jgi:glycine/D-amino acid oxidase-like deaminating enzyme
MRIFMIQLSGIRSLTAKQICYFALGFGGNGITFSQLAAEMITDMLTGKKNIENIFSFERL